MLKAVGGWAGEGRGARQELRYLHCHVGTVGGSQQCHLLLTEGRDG